MKYLKYSVFCLTAILFAACGNEDELKSNVDFSSPYVLIDNPDDPIQHRCYEIYQKYGVPVFFNDTIEKKQVGVSPSGEPVMRFETLDMNWEFNSHSKGDLEFSYEYLKTVEQQEKALDFAEKYLEKASKPMRPFCFLLVDKITIESESGTVETPEFRSGFRTLAVAGMSELADADIEPLTTSILRNLVKSRVNGNSDLVEEFKAVSEKFYGGKRWYLDLGCEPDWMFKTVALFPPSRLWNDKFISETKSYYGIDDATYNEWRIWIIEQIGQFGFICGKQPSSDKGRDGFNSPDNVEEDLGFYLDMMLSLGSEEFLNRYGNSPLVLKKYNLLNDFISDKLGIEL